jgi:5'-3' exonuclease
MPARPTLVLDSASLYYRAFYALPASMTAPDGRPHNAVRGFLSTLSRLVDAHAPGGIVACWDNDWRPQWRVDLIPTYKAHRVAEGAGSAEGVSAEDEPEDLGPQVEAIAAILDALGIARWGADGYEADDVIGSVAHQSSDPCIVVSGDRDLVQLISPTTRLLLTVNGGMEKWPLLDPEAASERFGVAPERYVDMAVLRGDPSDGLPGVAGIGAKTAVALVNAFGSCDGILEAARTSPAQRPMTPRLSAGLIAAAEQVARARVVAGVVTDLALPEESTALADRREDPEALADVVPAWGVRRQVDDLLAAIRRHTADE